MKPLAAAAYKLLAPAFLLASCALAQAQALQDPTRPPAAAGVSAAHAAEAKGPQLQTVLVGRAPGGRHLAVIDGETVRLGDAFHGARVASIRDNEVVLVRGRERQVLRLYDSVAGAVTPVAGAAPAAPAGAPAGALAAQR